jgi:DNA repair photolyase
VPVRVQLAPIIAGLNDSEIPALLAAIKVSGALGAGFTMLRLPGAVEPLFRGWIEQTQPGRLRKIEGRLRASSSLEPGEAECGNRARVAGDVAKPVGDVFRVFATRYRLDGDLPALDCAQFRTPRSKSGQLLLF